MHRLIPKSPGTSFAFCVDLPFGEADDNNMNMNNGPKKE